MKPESVEKVRMMIERQDQPEVIFDALFSLQKEIYHALESNYLKPFLESELFLQLQKDYPNLQEDYFDFTPSSSSSSSSSGGDASRVKTPNERAVGGDLGGNILGSASQQTRQHRPGVLFTAELKDVLVNSTALYYFMQFAERNVEVKNMINFYLTVERFVVFSFSSSSF